jgi:hypothetical protein
MAWWEWALSYGAVLASVLVVVGLVIFSRREQLDKVLKDLLGEVRAILP